MAMDTPRRIRPAFILVVGVLVSSCGTDSTESPPSTESGGRGGLPRGTLTITGEGPEVQVQVEIAETLEAKVRGLMGRTSLAQGAGMVFLESEPTTTGFWMKDTLIPLSVAFWDEERRIFRILDMEPCPEEPCPTYEPKGAWVGALEVNQGFFDSQGVEVGDRVELRRRSPN